MGVVAVGGMVASGCDAAWCAGKVDGPASAAALGRKGWTRLHARGATTANAIAAFKGPTPSAPSARPSREPVSPRNQRMRSVMRKKELSLDALTDILIRELGTAV